MGSRLNDVRKLQGMLSENNTSDHPDLDFLPPRDTLTPTSLSNGPPPAFLTKLWQLVNEGDKALVSWSSDGTSFIVRDQNQFAKKVLPNYFKHQKMNSFVRQLNMYGFKKVPKMTEGTLQAVECEPIEFANDFFIRGKMELLQHIKRKDAKARTTQRDIPHGQLSDLLHDLKQQQQQTHKDFERLKERNQELWRQVGNLRKKHDKQQDTVNRLISFMIHFIQQTPNQTLQIGGKRPAALALTNGEDDTNTVYKYLRTDEDRPSVSVRNNRGNVSGSQFNPPESPLTTAMKASNILVDENPSQTYFIKSDGENTLMSSDPDAPEIQEVFPESEKSSTKTGPSHFTLVPVDGDVVEATAPSVELKSASPDRIQTIEQSITSLSQESTLSSIMNLIGEQPEAPFQLDEMNFDEFTSA